ncbi:hypothetical protein PPERSA_07225 [Pseudocohnilembus persalinus]|uniref:Transmembrane protein n=1 Tax=Pseudocohnilembus persalinus TaxID=266149 RepID=A0A0V0QD54_PSEPJ|nr:hypothetical protein PPERSA_07225 [Pseudocohnilembus persalinus]|eukprot:KRX00118.1 hypothetical protein PPERSA_07225 [Pseudocohnilembus persalinus]
MQNYIPLIEFIIIFITEILFDKLGVDFSKRKSPQQIMKEQQQENEQNQEEKTEYDLKMDQMKELQKEITEMTIQAEKLNNPSTFAKYSKLLRQISKKQQQVQDLEQWLNQNYQQYKKQKEQSQSINQDEKIKHHQELAKKKLDLQDKGGALRNLRIVCPILFGFIFGIIFGEQEIQLKQDFLYPISSIFFKIQENQITNNVTYIVGNYVFCLACFRITSLLNKLFIGKSFKQNQQKTANLQQQ